MAIDKPGNLYEIEKPGGGSVPDAGAIIIPVIEEKAVVSKELVETARVRLVKTVKEHQEMVTLPLTEEELTVERKPVDRYVEEAPAVRQEGDTTIYPVLREVLVVEKKLLLVEEIHVRRQQRTTIVSETVTLRSESVSVDRETIQ